MSRPWVFVGALAAYLSLSGNVDLRNAFVGTIVAAGVAVLTCTRGGTARWGHARSAVLAGGRYAAHLFADTIRSGWAVAAIVARPSMPARPGLLRIPSGSRSDEVTALSAHGITVTPGQVVFAIDDQNGMWTHCLDSAGGDEPELRAQAKRRDILEEICGVGR